MRLQTFPNLDPAPSHQRKKITKSEIFESIKEIEETSRNLKSNSTKYKNKNKIKKNLGKLNYLFQQYIYPNVLGTIIYIVISYVDKILPCNQNSLLKYYRSFITIFFEISFYPLLGYLMIFIWIFKNMPKNKRKNAKIFILVIIYVEICIFQYLYTIGLIPNRLGMHASLILTGLIVGYAMSRKYKIKFKDIKNFYCITFIFFLVLCFHHYIIKDYVIFTLNEDGIFIEMEIFFQLILFAYFQIYREGIYYLLLKFCKISKFNDPFLIFLKYFISDMICSSAIPVISSTYHTYTIILNLIIYSYQLAILYCQKSFILSFLKKFIYYLMNKKIEPDTQIEKTCKTLIAMSINEILLIIYIKLILIFIFRKFLVYTTFGINYTDSCLMFKNELQIEVHYIFLLFMIQILIGGSVYYSKRNKNDFIWSSSKLTKFRIIKKAYHVIFSYNYIEIYIQFYFYLAFNHSKMFHHG